MIWPDLPERETLPLDEHRRRIGQPCRSGWVVIDQRTLDDFAVVTGDDAFIHTDPQAAARTRFGGTIAHGLLIVALLPRLMRSAVPIISDRRMGVNYGYDRVRFLAPVPCGARVRGQFTLGSIDDRGNGLHTLRYAALVDIEGVDKPALVAEWLIGCWVDAVD